MILEVTESRRIDDPHAAVAISVRCVMPAFGWRWMISAWATRAASAAAYEIVANRCTENRQMFVEGLPEDSSMIAAIIMLRKA